MAALRPSSALYWGRVQHRRHGPIDHAFSYRIYMTYLDLDELPQVLEHYPWASARVPSLTWFRRRDHFGVGNLAKLVRDTVQRASGVRPPGPIRLLTHCRIAGFVFNPVSFYYCFEDDGRTLHTVVAEVDNTPWGQRHLYVLPRARAHERGRRLRFYFDKTFHVSPFMPMNVKYDWTFSVPGSALTVRMVNREAGRRSFDAALALERRPLGRGELKRSLLGLPLMTAKVFSAIYANAFRLWLAGAPFYRHPGPGRRRWAWPGGARKYTVSVAPPLPAAQRSAADSTGPGLRRPSAEVDRP